MEKGTYNILILNFIILYKEVKIHIAQLYAKAQTDSADISVNDLNKIEEIYKRSTTSEEINREIGNLLKSKAISMPKATLMHYMKFFDDKKKYEFYISEAEKSARKSQKIIVISDAQKEKFMSLFPFAKDKVELLENGYDPKIFYVDSNVDKEETFGMLSSDRAENGKISTDYDTLVLFVGKFADFKGIDSLLTAAKQYEGAMQKENNKPLTLIVGSGALEPKLKAQADQLQLENTHFVGRLQHDMICKLQNLADVSVIPSRDEPFGLVVIEGTACGHPVIGSNSGGITGILNTSKKPLPMQDIIQTPLGVLIKPLPNRPKDLTENQLDLLDKLTTDYVVAEDDERQQILKNAQEKLGISEETLSTYFMEYAQSTNALSTAVLKIANHELTFDNSAIHDYTEKNYSQHIIRDKLINIFDEAESIYAKEAKSHED